MTREPDVDQAVLERLEALGYLGGSQSTEGERNLAAIAFQEGHHEDAAKIYRRLIEEEPEDAGLRTSLAGTLGALGLYDDAVEQLSVALALDPLNVEAYHNRAVIHERRGEPELAIADYGEAVRYAPNYEPSQAALIRLTGTVSVNAPKTEAEQQARLLAERASQIARHGGYEEAWALLDQAVAIAPSYSLIYQYRSNVAYLSGNVEGAVSALEQALELEPDNALFRQNLERLRDGAAIP